LTQVQLRRKMTPRVKDKDEMKEKRRRRRRSENFQL
jgi:hypothetical protein